jgi:protein-L-isoaspartate(D-aspartate) O-methyltransferase
MKKTFIFLYLIMGIFSMGVHAADDYSRQRQQMVADIQVMVSDTRSYIGKAALDDRVMAAMSKVPRHELMPDEIKSHAYVNSAMPIGENQTISQPYIVALMTDLAAVDKNSKVLEIGTGSGYQAAVLAELVDHVYTIEIIEVLGRRAEEDLRRLGYENITVRIGDGYHGWPEHAPFDAILVTAAIENAPEALIEQLKPGGKMVIPLGRQHSAQTLTVIEKNPDGEISYNKILPVGFVPLTGDR